LLAKWIRLALANAENANPAMLDTVAQTRTTSQMRWSGVDIAANRRTPATPAARAMTEMAMVFAQTLT
jgi:hypothetical protein